MFKMPIGKFVFIIVFFLGFFSNLTVVHAQIDDDEETSAAPAAPAAPDLSEYDNVPPGLLVPPDETTEDKAAEDNLPAVDPTTIPTFFALPGVNNPQSQEDDTSGHTMTFEQIVSQYKKGKYKEILETVKSMAQYSSHEAEELLGIMYLYGQGIDKDPKKALEYLTKAAEAGKPLAEHHLGVMYFTGQGMEAPDEIHALMWLHLAILHYPDGAEKDRAQKDRDGVYAKLSRYDKQQAMGLVRDWLEKRGEEHLIDLQ